MKRALTVFTIVLGVCAAALSAALCYYFGVTAGVRLDPAKLTLDTSAVRLLDAAGEEIPFAKKQSAAPYSSFPAYLPNAFVAVEDKHFYTHHGFDYARIGKAALKNLAHFSFREGASTISQQLIKNTHLSGEKTFARKLKELKLTRVLEKRYGKDEILEKYLNSIYFGHSAFGITEASAFYFGKEPCALTPAECATLAALVCSPNRYSPFRNAEKCLLRRNLVLRLMREQGYLSEAQLREALLEELPKEATVSGENAYLSRVYEELDEAVGSLRGRSLRVYTFYEPALQARLEETKAESDVCALVRDNKTHGIKALYSTCGTPKRLPASTIKPLLVYAPALEENLISPLTPLLDEKTDFGGYAPDDYGGASNTYMSARYALAHSVNIPAVRILNTLGVKRGANYLAKMQLRVEPSDYSLALALGGMKKGFTLCALADGYATLANGGIYSPSGTIRRVEDEKGREIYRFRPEKRAVFSEDVCALVSDMLQTAAREGTAKKLRSLPFPVCAKTGTNGTNGGNTDAYTLSYTREDTVGVWMGNQDNSPIEATGGGLPADAALEILRFLYKDRAPEPFPVCDAVESVLYDKAEYEQNHRILRADPAAPPGESGRELFRRCALPKETSSKYSRPTVPVPEISVKNGAVVIKLCHAEYYDYIIKRENCGVTTTIYSGKYRDSVCDNSVKSGESYVYTVIPVFREREGEPLTLPPIYIGSGSVPDGWWEERS